MTARALSRPIAATDRVSDVLARDESLVDVFVRLAPHFSKLRNRAMRRVMARLVTVEQAARMAGVSTDRVLAELNGALGARTSDDDAASPSRAAPGAEPGDAGAAQRSASAVEEPHTHPADAPLVELDVRDELRAGREPFSTIMTAVSRLGDDCVLHLRTTFEPVPLLGVLAKRGFAHETRSHAAGDWSAWFWRQRAEWRSDDAGATSGCQPSPSPGDVPAGDDSSASRRTGDAASSQSADDDIVWLDVRGLEPPEPLVRTLAALETLPAHQMLVQVNVRVPQFLLPVLAERGFACDIDESHADRVLVRIWRPA